MRQPLTVWLSVHMICLFFLAIEDAMLCSALLCCSVVNVLLHLTVGHKASYGHVSLAMRVRVLLLSNK